MTPPRRILPGQVAFLTRRTIFGQYLLRPDEQINDIIGFELAKASNRHGLPVHGACAMSNHVHFVVSDMTAKRHKLMQDTMSGIARARNDHLDRYGTFWGAGQYNNTALLDKDAIERKLVYTWLNPVRAGLVKRVEDWPGFQILPKHWGETIEIQQPDVFYGRNSPETVTITPQPPPGYDDMSLEEVKEHFQELIREEEEDWLDLHPDRGFKGAKAVRLTNPYDTPDEKLPERSLDPRFATQNEELMREAKRIRADFLDAYEQKRQRWVKGRGDVVFPRGTVQLSEEAPVKTEPPDPSEPGILAPIDEE